MACHCGDNLKLTDLDAGQAALPGGKADTIEETAVQTARREAQEEIGLPRDDKKLPSPFKIEHLCQLPTNLAFTELGVQPCVAFLHSGDSSGKELADVEESMIPRLDAREVSAVFSAPFHNLLKKTDEVAAGEEERLPGVPSDWYEGSWSMWRETRFRMHIFYVPIAGHTVTKPKSESEDKSQSQGKMAGRTRSSVDAHMEEAEKAGLLTRYKVFGMTARILVDAARVAYAEEPEFEYTQTSGDEDMIRRLMKMGRLKGEREPSAKLDREDMIKASKI
ncbi:MAG: hypothetical protein M4579_002930 [Chaenotheca gracillima]|nr:MAG: hypothetical protein M4579_002930 [Chaenotheca gracillima]